MENVRLLKWYKKNQRKSHIESPAVASSNVSNFSARNEAHCAL